MTRRLLDAYYTPPALASRLVGITKIEPGESVLEPHAGGGAFVRTLTEAGLEVSALDVNPEAPGLELVNPERRFVGDFLSHKQAYDWVIGNPPYSDAEAHVRHALSIAKIGVAFLLRLAFLESASRELFWKQHPATDIHVLSRRPSFTCGGTDNCAYGWFIWVWGYHGPATLHVLTGESK